MNKNRNLNPFPNHFRILQTQRLCRRQVNENGRKSFKRVENSVGKGEIARFSFSHSVFKDLYCRHIKTRACLGKGFKLRSILIHSQTIKKKSVTIDKQGPIYLSIIVFFEMFLYTSKLTKNHCFL